MEVAKKIAELEAKREVLEKLLIPGIDKDREIAIRKNIDSVTQEIVKLYDFVPKPKSPERNKVIVFGELKSWRQFFGGRESIYDNGMQNGAFYVKGEGIRAIEGKDLQISLYFASHEAAGRFLSSAFQQAQLFRVSQNVKLTREEVTTMPSGCCPVSLSDYTPLDDSPKEMVPSSAPLSTHSLFDKLYPNQALEVGAPHELQILHIVPKVFIIGILSRDTGFASFSTDIPTAFRVSVLLLFLK